MRAGLERIGQDDLDSPIQLRSRTELGLLAEEGHSVTLLPIDRAPRTPHVDLIEDLGVEVFTGEWVRSIRSACGR